MEEYSLIHNANLMNERLKIMLVIPSNNLKLPLTLYLMRQGGEQQQFMVDNCLTFCSSCSYFLGKMAYNLSRKLGQIFKE